MALGTKRCACRCSSHGRPSRRRVVATTATLQPRLPCLPATRHAHPASLLVYIARSPPCRLPHHRGMTALLASRARPFLLRLLPRVAVLSSWAAATRALGSLASLRVPSCNTRSSSLACQNRGMALQGQQQFPPQQQESQPGKEHLMDPRPEAITQHYKPASKLQGKVALVTGGDSGIGRAVCLCFALEGATVAFTYVKGQEEKDAEETLRALGDIRGRTGAREPMAVAADLGYEEGCRKVVGEVAGAYGGRIDVLVNNAAEQYVRPSITELTEEGLERLFRTNFFGYALTCKHAVPHMARGGSIINTSSINAYKGNAALLDYTASKGAIVAFTRALALELAEKGIRVNGVAPGPIWTPLIPASFPKEKVAQFGSEVPMKRAGQPIEVAPSFVFLASDQDSSYMSGQMLHVNGGVIVNG